ncbi:MAG: aspartate dehydrogenase [Halobacteriota archaeon]|nr:aspartate dehydrogenase [Halobacteriota archaeon]
MTAEASSSPIKVGVVGLGAIGREICKAVDSGMEGFQLVAVTDRKIEFAMKFAASLSQKTPFVDISEMLDMVDLVVESASQQAVREVAIPTLKRGKSILIMSVGALLDEELFKEVKTLSRENNCRVYLPSGAITGLDGLKSASIGKITSVTLTTRKPPSSLKGALYLKEKGFDLDSLEEEKVIFIGSAGEAVKLFPANVNVAASISIAGIGQENTKVRIVADPALSKNTHEIHVEGEFGEFRTRVENVPSPFNPKTSYLAALSAIATLKKIAEPIQVGT